MRADVELHRHTCAREGCGIAFWLEEGFENRRKADRKVFFCPNGHSLSYEGDTEVQKLNKIIESREDTIRTLQSDLRTRDSRKRKGR